jgi:hypothetical protein
MVYETAKLKQAAEILENLHFENLEFTNEIRRLELEIRRLIQKLEEVDLGDDFYPCRPEVSI